MSLNMSVLLAPPGTAGEQDYRCHAGETTFSSVAGSQNWWIRFQYPDHVPPDPKKVELSLGTPDRTQAEIKALPLIHR